MKKSQILMYAFWVCFLLLSLLDLFQLQPTNDGGVYTLASGIFCAILILMWLNADSQEIGVRVSPLLKVGTVVFAGVAVPVYLIKYKGLRRSLKSFSKFLGFLIAFFAILIVSADLGNINA